MFFFIKKKQRKKEKEEKEKGIENIKNKGLYTEMMGDLEKV